MRNIETIEKLGNLEVESEIKFNEFVSELTEKYSFDSENDLVIAIQNVKFGWKEMDAFSYLGNRMTWLAVLHLDFTEQKDLKDEEVQMYLSKVEKGIAQLTEYKELINNRISEMEFILSICKEMHESD